MPAMHLDFDLSSNAIIAAVVAAAQLLCILIAAVSPRSGR